jgi:hypothetical protein
MIRRSPIFPSLGVGFLVASKKGQGREEHTYELRKFPGVYYALLRAPRPFQPRAPTYRVIRTAAGCHDKSNNHVRDADPKSSSCGLIRRVLSLF